MCRATTCPPSIRKRRNRKQRNGLAADFGHVEASISSLDVSAGIDFFFFFCQFDFDHFFFSFDSVWQLRVSWVYRFDVRTWRWIRFWISEPTWFICGRQISFWNNLQWQTSKHLAKLGRVTTFPSDGVGRLQLGCSRAECSSRLGPHQTKSSDATGYSSAEIRCECHQFPSQACVLVFRFFGFELIAFNRSSAGQWWQLRSCGKIMCGRKRVDGETLQPMVISFNEISV